MGYTPRYDNGDWKTICDVCGREYKASQLKQRWDGLKTCSDDWEPRQPQDFVRGVADTQAPPWTRPEQSNSFQPITYVYNADGQPFITPIVSFVSVLLGKSRPQPEIATSTSTATISAVTYPRPANFKTVNGFTVNTVTLG